MAWRSPPRFEPAPSASTCTRSTPRHRSAGSSSPASGESSAPRDCRLTSSCSRRCAQTRYPNSPESLALWPRRVTGYDTLVSKMRDISPTSRQKGELRRKFDRQLGGTAELLALIEDGDLEIDQVTGVFTGCLEPFVDDPAAADHGVARVDHFCELGRHGDVFPRQPTVGLHGCTAGVNRKSVFRLMATSVPSARWNSSHVSTKCPVPSRVFFSGDTETTSSITWSRSPSRMVVGNSTSLEALMNVVPGNGTRIAIDGVGGSSEGSHGGGITQPINNAGGAIRPPHA